MFYLGTHMPGWLSEIKEPLFVSRRRLMGRKSLPVRAPGSIWALDSGGFSELSLYDRWKTTAKEYAADVFRFAEIAGMQWAAPQDWMCEPDMLRRTGLTIAEHQKRTVDSVLELRAMGCPVIPVLQGWVQADYFECWKLYESAGIDLLDEPTVGLGSVCRRQAMGEAEDIVRALHSKGLRLHGFGFKTIGLTACGECLVSSDSLAWSYAARRALPLPGCRHRSCANCPRFALEWRAKMLATIQRPRAPRQQSLFS